MRVELQWLKPLTLARLMSRLKPRPTTRHHREHLHHLGTRARAHGAKKMAGGLPMPANQTFLSFREEGHAMPPENEPRLRGERYAVNELPHPQLRVACGFWKTNPRRIRSS